MSQDYRPVPESSRDFVPTCRWMDSCDLILQRDGCRTCDYTRSTPRDEDGDPYPPDPLREMHESFP